MSSKTKLKLALLISIALHVCLVGSMYLRPGPIPKPQAKPMYVELQEQPPVAQTKTKSLESAAHAKSSRTPKRAVGLSGSSPSTATASKSVDLNFSANGNLLQNWQKRDSLAGQPPSARAQGEDSMLSLEDAGQGYSRATQYSNSMDITFTNDTLGFFQSLHRKVDGALIFPEALVKARFNGKVRIEAEVTNKGELIDFVSSKADNDVLHAYSLALLVQVLKNPLPERTWLKTEKAIVVFDFDYEIKTTGQDPSNFIEGAQKNRLAFGRDGFVDPILNEKLTEYFTHYVPPIIPLPGGFYVDIIMAYQYVHNLATNAPLESEVRMAKAKSLHKELLQMIHSPREKPTATPTPSDS